MKRMNKAGHHLRWSIIVAIVMIAIITLVVIAVPFGSQASDLLRHADAKTQVAAISPDAHSAIVVDKQKIAYLWQLHPKKQHHELKKVHQLPEADFIELSNHGKYAIIAYENELKRWDLKRNRFDSTWEAPSKITAISLSTKGYHALAGLADGSIHYVDLAKGKSIHTFQHAATITSVFLSHNNRYALTSSHNDDAHYWDLKSGKMLKSLSHKGPIDKVLLSDNNKYALTHSNIKGTKVWDLERELLINKLDIAPMTLTSAKFSPDGTLVALGCSPQVLLLMDFMDNKTLNKWVLPKDHFWKPTEISIHAIQFSPKEKHLYTEDSTGHWRKWHY